MIHKRLLAITFTLLAPICGFTGAQPMTDDNPTRSTLASYHWNLISAADANGIALQDLTPPAPAVTDTTTIPVRKRLTLDFTATNISISGGCNRMNGAYEITGDQLRVSMRRSTMMACEGDLMKMDASISQLLSAPAEFSFESTQVPQLLLTAANGTKLLFRGQATAETLYGSTGEILFLEVHPQLAACNHPMMPNHNCLKVREIRYGDNGVKIDPPGDWQLLYENIEGYTHQEGIRNVLRVKKFQRTQVPTDASSIAYELDMTVESEIVKP